MAISPLEILPIAQSHLWLRVACAAGKSCDRAFIAHQYATYPFRLSGNLPLAPDDPHRVYAYVMNASPGMVSGDDLRVVVQVGDRANLYLSDQSATKVHSKPLGGKSAQISYAIEVGAEAYLEYVPEPVILFTAADLSQQMTISVHPQARVVLSEIIVPGRLARGEFYTFETFQSRLQVTTPENRLIFVDNFRLLGQSNPFRQSSFLTTWPIMANFVVISPKTDLNRLSQMLQLTDKNRNHLSGSLSEELENLSLENLSNNLQVCNSRLPNCHGLLIRALASRMSLLKGYQRHLLNSVRQLNGHPLLPHIPK